MTPRSLLVPAALLLLAAASCGDRPPGRRGTVTVRGRRIDVALFTAERDRRIAPLMFAAAPEDRGYLMSWPRERFCKIETAHGQAAFDVAFLDKSGRILELQSFVPTEPEGLMPRTEAAHALFVAPGLLKKLGAGPGEPVSLPPEAAQAQELPVLQIGGATAYVELALSEPERQHGLMFRPRMSADDGMLFAYPDEQPRAFWMKNTLIPLDIAFFASDGTLLNVNETPTVPQPRVGPWPSSPSAGPARFVLEMNLGWFRRHGLVDEAGRPKSPIKVQMPPEALRGSF